MVLSVFNCSDSSIALRKPHLLLCGGASEVRCFSIVQRDLISTSSDLHVHENNGTEGTNQKEDFSRCGRLYVCRGTTSTHRFNTDLTSVLFSSHVALF